MLERCLRLVRSCDWLALQSPIRQTKTQPSHQTNPFPHQIVPPPPPPGEVKTLMIQLLSGIAHLHDNWVVHRDLKTSNLLLSNQGVLKIGDFGLAREYGSPLKPYTPIVVTLWYRAPELLLGQKVGFLGGLGGGGGGRKRLRGGGGRRGFCWVTSSTHSTLLCTPAHSSTGLCVCPLTHPPVKPPQPTHKPPQPTRQTTQNPYKPPKTPINHPKPPSATQNPHKPPKTPINHPKPP